MPHNLDHLRDVHVRTEEILAAVLDTAAQPLWVVDAEDVIRFANSAAALALGYEEPAQLVGRHHRAVHRARGDRDLHHPGPVGPCRFPRTHRRGD